MARNRSGYNSDDSSIWEAERILGKRTVGGKLQYRIKWKDYTVKESTWEPSENILDPSLLNEFIKSKRNQVSRGKGRVRKSNTNSASTSSAATNMAEVERASSTPTPPPSRLAISSMNSGAQAGKKRGATIHSIAAALANGSSPAASKVLKREGTSAASSRAPMRKPLMARSSSADSGVHLPEAVLYASPVEYNLTGTTVELADPKTIPKGQIDIIITMNGKRAKFTQGFDPDYFKD